MNIHVMLEPERLEAIIELERSYASINIDINTNSCHAHPWNYIIGEKKGKRSYRHKN